MKRIPFIIVSLLLAHALGAAEIQLAGVSPETPALGQLEIEVLITGGDDVERVELRVDGRVVAERGEAPYRFIFDAGDGQARVFEAVAHLSNGQLWSTRVATPALVIHERIEADLQQLYATVTDRHGERVLGLGQEAFQVLDEGEAQEIVTLESGEIPFTAILLLDGSESMLGERIRAARTGAIAFAEGMHELDEAAVVVFSDRLLAATPSVSDPEVIREALEELEPAGGTALHDHLFHALRAVEERQGRRVVVLLSDGEDIHSVLRATQVREVVRRSQAQIYWVRLGLAPAARLEGFEHPKLRPLAPLVQANSWHDAEVMAGEREELEKTVKESGGRVHEIMAAAEIEGAFREILRELREQYAIGYYPTVDRDDGSWRRVDVRVRGRDLQVRTREGYLDR